MTRSGNQETDGDGAMKASPRKEGARRRCPRAPMPIRTRARVGRRACAMVVSSAVLGVGACGEPAVDPTADDELAEDTRESTPAPYPPSPVFAGVEWRFDSMVRRAPGSDLWPVTWAADGHLYASWGDGGGFGGTNENGRVSLGFVRIEGEPDALTGTNVWGGHRPANPATFGGKVSSLLSVDGVLYATLNLQDGSPPNRTLAWSDDLGSTWRIVSWVFPGGGSFEPQAFLNFGRDYQGARDEFVYVYGKDRTRCMELLLARVPKTRLRQREAYRFYAGTKDGEPVWSSVAEMEPVFRDPDGVGAVAAAYHPPSGRYLLTTHHRNYVGRFGFFDAPEPWGPWTTVAYYDDWVGLGHVEEGMPHTFPAKWMSPDGRTAYMVFSGREEWDSFNLVEATFRFHDPSSIGGPSR